MCTFWHLTIFKRRPFIISKNWSLEKTKNDLCWQSYWKRICCDLLCGVTVIFLRSSVWWLKSRPNLAGRNTSSPGWMSLMAHEATENLCKNSLKKKVKKKNSEAIKNLHKTKYHIYSKYTYAHIFKLQTILFKLTAIIYFKTRKGFNIVWKTGFNKTNETEARYEASMDKIPLLKWDVFLFTFTVLI